jgi:hypothetical protein
VSPPCRAVNGRNVFPPDRGERQITDAHPTGSTCGHHRYPCTTTPVPLQKGNPMTTIPAGRPVVWLHSISCACSRCLEHLRVRAAARVGRDRGLLRRGRGGGQYRQTWGCFGHRGRRGRRRGHDAGPRRRPRRRASIAALALAAPKDWVEALGGQFSLDSEAPSWNIVLSLGRPRKENPGAW